MLSVLSRVSLELLRLSPLASLHSAEMANSYSESQKIDALLCVVILLLIATWLQIATIHHMMLEKKGEIV